MIDSKKGLSKKIKVLYTIPNFDTAGSGKVVYDLAKSLNKNEFDVEIACSNAKGKFFPIVEALGLKIHIVSTTIQTRPFYSFPIRLFKIIRFFQKHQFDIIHSWHWSSDWTEALAAKIAGIPWMYTKKAMSWGNARNWKLRSRLASFITTINPDMEKEYFNGFDNVKLLPLGLDTDYYSYQQKRSEYETIQYDTDDFVVISVVNLIKAKGIEVLVDAIKLINDPKVKLLVVGDYSSGYGTWVYNKVATENLHDRIHFTGKVVDIRNYLALSDMFVTPTNVNWEGMPMAPVEAMSSGRIVIGTNTSGINYILSDFPNLLVPPNNAEAIAAKIMEIKHMNNNSKMTLEHQIRNKVITDFSIVQFCNNYTSLYKKILHVEN